jgi:predicted glycosyltransferase
MGISMKVLFGMGHPAHVHFFKNIIRNLEHNGHEVKIVVRDREIAIDLLQAYGFKYSLFGKYRKNFAAKVAEIPINDYIFYEVAKEFKPDVLTGILNYTSSHVGKLIGKPSVIFTDTENAKLANKLVCPFADVICTPSCFKGDFGSKHVRYNGYHELSYLHPNNYKPDPTVLEHLELDRNEKYIILRLVSWNAAHDIGDRGFKNIKETIKSLESYGKILITSESKLDPEFEKYKISSPPDKIHDLLYYAHLYIGESATMASESAVLGTPSIYCATSRRGYTDELEEKYNLVYNFSDKEHGEKLAIEKAIDLLENNSLKRDWEEKRRKMLKDKVDVAKFATDLIESYF